MLKATVVGVGDGGFRTEIGTPPPFGGLAYPNPIHSRFINFIKSDSQEEMATASSMEEQAARLEKELTMKEKDTFEVLKELQAAKMVVEDLKSKVRIAESAILPTVKVNVNVNVNLDGRKARKPANESPVGVLNAYPSSAPGLILLELKQAKLNLTKTTTDLAGIRASVESYKRKVEKERVSLEKTRERLSSNSLMISSLEKELNTTGMKLHLVKDGGGVDVLTHGKDVATEIHRLSCERELFKKLGGTAKAGVVRVMSEIEKTKAKAKSTEVKLTAARRMKDAASTAEAVALAEIKVLEKSGDSLLAFLEKKSDRISLTYEEYSLLTSRAEEGGDNSKKRVMDALRQVDKANMSKMGISKRVDEAIEEAKTSKKALEDALNKVEEADKAKLAAEETLRKWRSEHRQKRRSVQSSAKFKIYGPTDVRRDSQLLDLNGVHVVSEVPAPVLKSSLSIRQILSKKLLVDEEFEPRKSCPRQKVSLGEMLAKHSGELSTSRELMDKEDGGGGGSINTPSSSGRKLPTKRKKFGFARFSVLLAKQSGKKKKKKKKKSPMKTAAC